MTDSDGTACTIHTHLYEGGRGDQTHDDGGGESLRAELEFLHNLVSFHAQIVVVGRLRFCQSRTYSLWKLVQKHCLLHGLIAGSRKCTNTHQQGGWLAVSDASWSGQHAQQLGILLRCRPAVRLEECCLHVVALVFAGSLYYMFAFRKDLLRQRLLDVVVLRLLSSDLRAAECEIGLDLSEP